MPDIIPTGTDDGRMKSLVVISDVHVGSKLAPMGEAFTETDGTHHTPNRVQKALYGAWQEVVEKWHRPDILVLNGEPFDGQQTKSFGTEVWTTNYLEQIRCAVRLVREFDAKKIYLTRGSNYHVQVQGVGLEEVFGEQIGAEEIAGEKVHSELFLKVNETTFSFAHHIAGSLSGWMYRSTPISKEIMLGKLNESHRWPAQVYVRSHNHYFWAVQSTSTLGVMTPAWQLQNWFAFRKTATGSIPDIGAIRFMVGAEKDDYALQKMIFRLQEAKPPLVVA